MERQAGRVKKERERQRDRQIHRDRDRSDVRKKAETK